MMDTVLCDELLQEIFHHLPSSSFSAVSLVSKRWRRLLRSSTVALSLQLTSLDCSSISSFLSSHPYLSSLSLSTTTSTSASSDHLLSVAFSCPHLRFLSVSDPVSLPPLLSLSVSCPLLTCLVIGLSRPLVLYWIGRLRFLKDLTLFINGSGSGSGTPLKSQSVQLNFPVDEQTELRLLSLSISGVRAGDDGVSWLWRNCKQLKKLKLTSCEFVGDESSFSAFIRCLKGLQEVELRSSRTIADGVLQKIAENCVSLDSLLVYDGCSKQGLLHFIVNSRCRLRKLDLRLPLDLYDDHLIAMAVNFRNLSSLNLQSSCLVTGEGLMAVGRCVLEELSLIECDAIERESGLLTTLGQKLRNLKVLDLSYNEDIIDREVTSMLLSCCNLIELKLRGCNKVTDAALTLLISCCKQLEIVDLLFCHSISAYGIELLVMKCMRLRQIHIEVDKISDAAKRWASIKCIEIACLM